MISIRLLRAGLAFVILALAPCSAHAETYQVPLTPQLIEGWISSYAELNALGGELKQHYGDRSEEGAEEPIDSIAAYTDIPEAKQKIDALVVKFGFTDLDQWMRVSESIVRAYQYTDPSVPQPDPEAEKAKDKAAIEADTSLTPEKKAEALQQLDEQYASIADEIPLPGNIEMVRPFVDRIKPLYERAAEPQ